MLCTGYLSGGNVGSLKGSVIFIIVLGAVIFGIAFFGCCGAVRESHFMLTVFAISLMIIIVLQVIAAILVFVTVGGFEPAIQNLFVLARDGGDGQNDALSFVNELQQNLKCCGTTDASFWTKVAGSKIPDSCCDTAPCTQGNAYDKPCVKEISWYVDKYGQALGAVAIVVALIEIIGVWFALGLAGEIKKLSR